MTLKKLPQPHEDVTGIHRTRDDLLSLEETALRRRVVILRIARELWTASLRGAGNDYGRDAFSRMEDPRIGDLVCESGTAMHPDRKGRGGEAACVHGFGIMLGDREEWTCSHEEWRGDVEQAREDGYMLTDDDRASVRAMYIQYGPGPKDVCRWENARLFALPTGMLYHTEDQQD